MKVTIIGSTQSKHIAGIYQDAGWKTKALNKTKGKFIPRLQNALSIITADLVYCVGALGADKNKLLGLARIFRKRIILHWIGSDVLEAAQKYNNNNLKTPMGVCNLAVSIRLKDELKAIGIDSKYVPIAPNNIPYPPAPAMPEHHAVLAYIPEGKEYFYGWTKVCMLADSFPETIFYIVANKGQLIKYFPKNVKFMGTLSHEQLMELYREISILLRLTEHDGLPVMILEAQAMGRKVIHSFELPFIVTPKDGSDEALVEAFNSIVCKPPTLDLQAKEYVDKTYSRKAITEVYVENGLV